MYIYKIYKTREEIEKDYKDGKLKKDYIFAYDRRLYKVNCSPFTFYEPMSIFVFKNTYEKNHVVKMCNLIWYATDSVHCIDTLEEICIAGD